MEGKDVALFAATELGSKPLDVAFEFADGTISSPAGRIVGRTLGPAYTLTVGIVVDISEGEPSWTVAKHAAVGLASAQAGALAYTAAGGCATATAGGCLLAIGVGVVFAAGANYFFQAVFGED